MLIGFFDTATLKSPLTKFALVGIVNRMDRLYVSPETCGEVRLIYRLAYRVASLNDPNREAVASRLPMTLNLVFNARDPLTETEVTCDQIAKRWTGLQLSPEFDGPAENLRSATVHGAIASLLDPVKGPIAPSFVNSSKLKQIEVNLQAVRWPAVTRADLGGQSEYLLKIFSWNPVSRTLTEKVLENQPDVALINNNTSLKKELKAWITSHLQEINDGNAVIPDKFLAKKALDFAPHGLQRLVNHPFQQIFSPADFAGATVELSSHEMIRTPTTLLRRLDDHSCTTCHQTRNMAGFHLMGKDPSGLYPGNTVFVGGSPHLFADQLRRLGILEAITQQKIPPLREAMPTVPKIRRP